MLPGAGHIRELEVDHPHAELLGHREHVCGVRVALAGELLDRQGLSAADEVMDCGLLWCHGHGWVDSSLQGLGRLGPHKSDGFLPQREGWISAT